MRITRVRFQNYCQHSKRDDELRAGVIGIVGPNGAGKSNYVKGIKRAFTGQTDNAGKNEDDLSWDANDKPGFVHIDFIAQDHGSIKRNLSSSSCSMNYGDAVKLKKASDIDAKIYEILGVKSGVLSEIIFIGQGEIEKILFQRPAERAKALQSLFQTESAESIRILLSDELGSLNINTASAQITELADRYNKLKKDHEEATTTVNTLVYRVLGEDVRTKLTALVQSAWQHQTQAGSVNTLAAQCTTLKQSMDAQQAIAEKQGKLKAELEKVLGEFKADYDKAKQRTAQAGVVNQQFNQRQHWLSKYNQASQVLQEVEPALPPELAGQDLNTIEARIRDLTPDVMTARKLVRQFPNPAAPGECPTCTQAVPADFVARMHAIASVQGKELGELETLRGTLMGHVQRVNREKAAWQQRRDTAVITVREAETQLANLPDVQPVSQMQLAEDQAVISEYETTQSQLTRTDQSVTNALNMVNSLAVQYKQAYDAWQAANTALGTAPDPKEVSEAKERLAVHEQNNGAYTAAQTKVEVLGKQLVELKAQLSRLEENEAKLDDVKRYRDLCEKAKMLLHRDALPNIVAQAYLKSINAKLAKYLEIFEVPFTAYFEPDLSIKCVFGKNRQVVAERLSGGQKVMLGIAFRFALYDLFVNNLGLMVLDEPTAYLDRDRIDAVVELLERVKSYSQSAGLQLLVVTHDPRLQGVFDQVIKI